MVNIKSKISTRVLSFLLAFIMLFSMLPLSTLQIYADDKIAKDEKENTASETSKENSEETSDGGGMANAGGGQFIYTPSENNVAYGKGDFNSTLNSGWGYKISIWFAPTLKEAELTSNGIIPPEYGWISSEVGDLPAMQVGANLYFRELPMIDINTGQEVFPAFWSTTNIFEQTTLGRTWGVDSIQYAEESPAPGLELKDYIFKYYPTSLYKDAKGFEYKYPLISTWYMFLIHAQNTDVPISQYVKYSDIEKGQTGHYDMNDWFCRLFDMEDPYSIRENLHIYWDEFQKVYSQFFDETKDIKLENINTLYLAGGYNSSGDYISGYYRDNYPTYRNAIDEFEKIESEFLKLSVDSPNYLTLYNRYGDAATKVNLERSKILKDLFGEGTAFYKATLAMFNKSFGRPQNFGWNMSYNNYAEEITSYNVMADVNDLQMPYTLGQHTETGCSAEYIKSYFLNPIILNDVSANSNVTDNNADVMTGRFNVTNFFNGVLYIDGEYVKGQYKIYIEPALFRKVTWAGLSALTWRDLMMEWVYKGGFYKNDKNYGLVGSVLNHVPPLIPQLYSGLWLEHKDDSLYFDVDNDGIREENEYIGYDSSVKGFKVSEIRDVGIYNGDPIRLASNPLNNLGVGVITSPSLASFPEGPQILTTYVEIDSVDEYGNVTYRETELATTKLEDAEFLISEDGNITRVPNFEVVEGAEGGQAYLNDIISTDKDFNITDFKKAQWLNTEVPTDIGIDLQLNAEDIAGYRFGLITGSDVFVNDVTKIGYVSDTNSVIKTIEKVVNTINSVVENNTGLGYEEFRIQYFKTPRMVYNPNLDVINIEVEDTVLGTKNVVAVEYGEYTDVNLGEIVDNRVQKVKIYDNLDNKSVIGDIVVGNMTLDEFASLSTPANNLILRYIIKPGANQINIVEKITLDSNGNQIGNPVYISGGIKTLDINNGVVNIQDPELPSSVVFEGDPVVQGWVTNSQYPYITGLTDTLPTKSPNGLEGSTKVQITNYPEDPITHNLYVKWQVIERIPDVAVQYEVPEWRLSKLWNAYSEVVTTSGGMSLTLKSNDCNHSTPTNNGYPYLTNSTVGDSWTGVWNYSVVNANGSISNNAGKDLRVEDWLHAETKKSATSSGYDTLSYSNPSTLVSLSTNLTGIKNTGDSGLKLASWLTSTTRSNQLKDNYNIESSNIGVHSTIINNNYIKLDGDSVYKTLSLGVKNKDTYKNGYARCYWEDDCDCLECKCFWCGCGYYYHGYYSVSITPTTTVETGYGWNRSYGVTYHSGSVKIEDIRFNRYTPNVTSIANLFKSLNDNGIIESGKKTNYANGLTTLRYQLSDTLNIYPEIGMLFEDDDGNETLEWVVGDEVRKIKPIVYQTLEHKVYVTPTSNGTSVATDSRGTTAANALANQDATVKGKQLIYKGAGVNTSYRLGRSSGSNSTALLTVKTYALDIGNATLKSAWGNSSYNSYSTHSSLITNIKNSNKATITEKLLVDAKSFGSLDLDNAKKTGTSKGYNLVSYSSNSLQVDGGNAVCFEHKLIIRGGNLIGVVMMNTDGTTTTVAINNLKRTNEDLYSAIVGMGLYNISGKNSTLFKDFENKVGDKLTEGVYATKLADSRRAKDNMNTPSIANISVGDGWYSEDTTVLVVKEYVSNFEVPSVSVSDKLPMTIKNLATPTNKAQFFSNIAKGYTYLSYDLKVTAPSVSGITDAHAYFEFSSYPNDDLGFGRQGVDYLVPNVSITDTTRMN